MLDNWHTMARRLSGHVNVVTVDQRNHGKSPHFNEMSYDLMAEDLLMLLDTLSLSEVILLGHSMGGKTAMRFADLHPDRVHKLVVVDIAPKAYKPGHLVYFKAFHDIDFSRIEDRKEANEQFERFEKSVAVRMFLLKNLEKNELGYRLKFNLEAIEKFYPELIGSLSFSWTISIPSLFISGGKSGYLLESDRSDIMEVFSNVMFSEIADSGHWIHAEKPEEFYREVVAFIA